MSAKVSRKSQGVRKAAAVQGKAAKVRVAKKRTISSFDQMLAVLPFSDEQLHRIFLAVILGGAVALAWFVAVMAGLPAFAKHQIAAVASDTGFEVRRVEVRGVKNLNELKVYERALAERNRAMPLVDVDALRSSLLELSWVQDARVSRQLPDTLVIDIVERKPHAVLRKADRFVLIDGTGVELETIKADRAKGKLLLSGPGARLQVQALGALMDVAPALKPQIKAAEWVGNRRWNLKFKTDQVLALPEGQRAAAKALVSFARLDGTNRLLGGKAVAFDMRASDRIYFRVPGLSAPKPSPSPAASASPAKPAPKPSTAAKPQEDTP